MDTPNDHDLLIRLDEKVETLIRKVDALTDDHEDRIRSLERQRWLFAGGASVIGTMGGWLIQFLVH